METMILTTIISSGCLLLGTILTVIISNSKIKTALELKQKSQQYQIEEIKSDLKEHNNYATHIPKIETEIEHIKESINAIKNKVGVL